MVSTCHLLIFQTPGGRREGGGQASSGKHFCSRVGISGEVERKTKKEMATHSSVLAWRIPGTREPGGLLSVGLHRVGHD